MCEKKKFFLYLLIALIGTVILITPSLEFSHVHAQEPTPLADHGTCIKCHENLYFLHDTGRWFCIRESPMRCVDCHGGDANAIKQEEAHASRKAHPILNEDASKCQECHPAECSERVTKFERVAGVSDVLVAFPYQPVPNRPSERPLAKPATEPVEYPAWISAIEGAVLVWIIGLAVTLYLFRKQRH